MLTFFKPCPRKTMFQTVAGKKFFEFTLDIAGQQAPPGLSDVNARQQLVDNFHRTACACGVSKIKRLFRGCLQYPGGRVKGGAGSGGHDG